MKGESGQIENSKEWVLALPFNGRICIANFCQSCPNVSQFNGTSMCYKQAKTFLLRTKVSSIYNARMHIHPPMNLFLVQSLHQFGA